MASASAAALLPASSSVWRRDAASRLGLALGVFLGRALLGRLRLPLTGIGLPSRRDVCLELGQFIFGLLPRLARLLELRFRLPFGRGFGLGLLACLVLEPALLRRQGIRLAPFGERLFKLLG